LVKVAYIKNASPGVNYHRLEVPFALIAEDERFKVFEVQIATDEYDVIVFNRIPFQPLSTLQRLKKQGIKIIFDIDDYWMRPIWHTNFSNQWELEFCAEIIKFLRLADIVWVSTPYLQQKIAEMLIESVLIPNALLYEEAQFNRVNIERDTINCGWVGGIAHHRDINLLTEPLKQPHKAKMVLGGVSDINNKYWQYIGQVLGGGKIKNVQILTHENQYNYGFMYNYLDIVLLPSFNDTYTMCKSNLKILEAGAHNLPVITNGVIYKEVTDKMGIRVNGQRDWVKGIKKLTESKRMRTELGLALGEYTREKYDIFKINEKRKQTIL